MRVRGRCEQLGDGARTLSLARLAVHREQVFSCGVRSSAEVGSGRGARGPPRIARRVAPKVTFDFAEFSGQGGEEACEGPQSTCYVLHERKRLLCRCTPR